MNQTVSTPPARAALLWVAIGAVIVAPAAAAGASPLLAWRSEIYILAGLAGVLAFGLLFLQPLLAASAAPGLSRRASLWAHRLVGASILLLVAIHVGGLWMTSPPDVLDALLFRSPTPFAVWGVLAMWALIATATLAILRRPLRLRYQVWRALHGVFAAAIIGGTIAHALPIEGAMEPITKTALCVLTASAALRALAPILASSRRDKMGL